MGSEFISIGIAGVSLVTMAFAWLAKRAVQGIDMRVDRIERKLDQVAEKDEMDHNRICAELARTNERVAKIEGMLDRRRATPPMA